MEPQFAELLPEVLLGLGPAEFARIAALALAPRPVPVVADRAHPHAAHQRPRAGRDHRRAAADAGPGHLPAADVRLPQAPTRWWPGSWRCSTSTGDGNVSFEQLVPLGDLYVTWAGSETGRSSTAGEED